MAKRNDGILDVVAMLPWPVGVALAAVAYVALKFAAPLIEFSNPFFSVWGQMATVLAPFAAGLLLVAALLSFIRGRYRARLLDNNGDLASIRSLSWYEFEHLVGEYYRRRGYTVEESGGGGADGGIDLRLRKGGELVLVQCKHWKTWKVGVNVVREMLGSMASTGASGGIVVTSGRFTADAWRFARQNEIALVDGNRLAEMVLQVRGEGKRQVPFTFASGESASSGAGRVILRALAPVALLAVATLGLVLFYGQITNSMLKLGGQGGQSPAPAAAPTTKPLSAGPVETTVRPAARSATTPSRAPAGGYYKWVDANGQTVYGDNPPADVEPIEVGGRLHEQNVIRR
jgi:restriction system protein